MKRGPVRVGDRFGRWAVLSKADTRHTPGGSAKQYWFCLCDCGTKREVQAPHLRSGRSESCGCHQRDVATALKTTHGGRDTLLYDVWTQMIQRCENPANKSYDRYGARGIKVCEAWRQFAAFQRDMAPTYQVGLTIDRRDNNGAYEPGNCRWVGNRTNCRNQERTVRVEWNGATVALADLADIYGIKQATAYGRFKVRGWTVRQTLGLDPAP